MTHIKSVNLKEQHAKMNRIARVNSVVEAIGNDALTKQEIADRSNVSLGVLDQGMLTELTDYDILEKASGSCGDHQVYATWTTKKPTNIEQLKADMMGATA